MSHERSDETPAYEGLRVVDLSQGVAGPHCGMLFALNGADVVKVEPPEGDWGRGIGKRHGDFSAYGVAFNRGKRSLALDLKRPEGREVAARLVARADVVVENNRPGVLARFGLDYEQRAGGEPRRRLRLRDGIRPGGTEPRPAGHRLDPPGLLGAHVREPRRRPACRSASACS